VTVKLSGGTAGTIAKVEARGVTAGGLTIEDTAVLEIGFDPVTLAEAKAAQKIDDDDEDRAADRLPARGGRPCRAPRRPRI
jgi:hypothetical protein